MHPTLVYSLLLAACSPAQDARPRPTSVPADAPEVDNDIYYLGSQLDPATGEDLEGYAIVDRVEDPTQEIDDADQAARPRRTCYAVLGYGSWKTVEDWGFDPSNSSGLADTDMQGILETGTGLWETASSGSIFGDYDSGNSGNASSSMDGENNIEFGNAGGGGIVAVTYIWGKYTGSLSSRYINEWDQIYDDRYDWTIGDPVGTGAFDFLDVAAHEIGHAAGLGHPPNTCTSETMYAYVATGETKKRDLTANDTTGINTLY